MPVFEGVPLPRDENVVVAEPHDVDVGLGLLQEDPDALLRRPPPACAACLERLRARLTGGSPRAEDAVDDVAAVGGCASRSRRCISSGKMAVRGLRGPAAAVVGACVARAFK